MMLRDRLAARLVALAFAVTAVWNVDARAEDQIDLNSAAEEDLEKLPGLGVATARRIIEYREQNGPFQAVEDLENVKGISAQTIEKLRARVTVGRGAGGVQVREISATKSGDDASGPATPAAAAKLLARYKNEPSVREVQEAAGRFAEVHPEIIESWRFRAKNAAWGPQLRGEMRWVSNDDLRKTTGGDRPDAMQQDTGSESRPLARAQWDLDRLIFNPDELRVSNEIVDLVRLRESVLDQVTKIYFERRRLQVDLDLTPPKDIAGRVRKELRLQELVADLDSLTGGFFSRKLQERGLDPY